MTHAAQGTSLPPAVHAFDAIAGTFDQRFGCWGSVAAQRRAVRRYLHRAFPTGSRVLELGAGTGEDAVYLLERGYRVTLTDGSGDMIVQAEHKVDRAGYRSRAQVRQLVLEQIDGFAAAHRATGSPPFDGIYSNFAALNCVSNLSLLAAPLAAVTRPGARCVLVMFGPFCLGELLVQLLRGNPMAAVRRLRRGPVPAHVGGYDFPVWYPAPRTVARALKPFFRLRRTRGIGILVPPSAAEPWISRFPRLLRLLEAVDRVLAAPLAIFGDHILLEFERTARPG